VREVMFFVAISPVPLEIEIQAEPGNFEEIAV
jgi:hypothetical protein